MAAVAWQAESGVERLARRRRTPTLARAEEGSIVVRMVRAVMGALLLGVVAATTATAAQPAMERVVFDDVGIHDDFVSDACGFDVWFDGTGHATFRSFSDAAGNPLRELNNYAIRVTYYSEFGSVTTQNVGPDRVTYEADGSITLLTTGSIESLTAPGQGRVYSDVGWTEVHITFDEDGEASFEVVATAGQHWGDEVEVLCGLLAPA